MVLWRRDHPCRGAEEYAGHITQMRACFAVLDGAVGKLNAELEEGSVPLRANRVKADFFALNFGAPDLTLRQGQAESFAGCYVSEAVRIRTVEVPNPEYDPPEDEEELEDYDVPKTIEVEQEYMVTVPEKDMAVVYARLHALLGAEFPEQWQANAAEIFYLAEYGADAVGGMSDGLIAGLVQDDSPEYIGGAFVSPLAGGWKNRVTSEMGGRYSPITGKWEGHRGLDMGRAERNGDPRSGKWDRSAGTVRPCELWELCGGRSWRRRHNAVRALLRAERYGGTGGVCRRRRCLCGQHGRFHGRSSASGGERQWNVEKSKRVSALTWYRNTDILRLVIEL